VKTMVVIELKAPRDWYEPVRWPSKLRRVPLLTAQVVIRALRVKIVLDPLPHSLGGKRDDLSLSGEQGNAPVVPGGRVALNDRRERFSRQDGDLQLPRLHEGPCSNPSGRWSKIEL
jgi:hypothetical protein